MRWRLRFREFLPETLEGMTGNSTSIHISDRDSSLNRRSFMSVYI